MQREKCLLTSLLSMLLQILSPLTERLIFFREGDLLPMLTSFEELCLCWNNECICVLCDCIYMCTHKYTVTHACTHTHTKHTPSRTWEEKRNFPVSIFRFQKRLLWNSRCFHVYLQSISILPRTKWMCLIWKNNNSHSVTTQNQSPLNSKIISLLFIISGLNKQYALFLTGS